jgi:hypothetical protein
MQTLQADEEGVEEVVGGKTAFGSFTGFKHSSVHDPADGTVFQAIRGLGESP